MSQPTGRSRTMDDLARFCCQDPDGPTYGQRNAGNLSVCARYGTHSHIRLLDCNACTDRFSERKGTPLFHTHLPEEKARSVLQHLGEGCGVPQTGRLVDVHRNSVVRLASRAGHTPATLMTSSWLFPPRTSEVQFDEMGAFVGKKQVNCDPADPDDDHKGDGWDHVAFDPEHKLVLAVVPGARVTESVEEVVDEVKPRLDEQPPR